MVLYFYMGVVIWTLTHALFRKKDADYRKHAIVTIIRHLPITREATFTTFRVN